MIWKILLSYTSKFNFSRQLFHAFCDKFEKTVCYYIMSVVKAPTYYTFYESYFVIIRFCSASDLFFLR